MNQNNSSQDKKSPKPIKIENALPVNAVGIESLKESYSDSMSSHRKIFKWFARRPTSATRLALLASILPEDVSTNDLLRYMCIGPKEGVDEDLEDYVLRKDATSGDRDGSVEEHFGYTYPHSRIPSESELSEFYSRLMEQWDGELPTVLDPTAGGGTIPLESARYGLSTISNELNPIAWVINKVILGYARDIGELESEIESWVQETEDLLRDKIGSLYPDRNGVQPNYYYRTYSILCPVCGERFPLSNKWWFNKKKNIAVRPSYDGELTFSIVDSSKSDFDPANGTVKQGDAECPHCDSVTERKDVTSILSEGNFRHEVGGVKYEKEVSGSKYHSPTKEDITALRNAQERVETDMELSILLNNDRYIGLQDRAAPYGMTRWRDLFTPRQLIAHNALTEVFEELRPQIQEKYDEETAEGVLVLLSLISVKQVNHNSRLIPIHHRFGYPADMLGNRNFAFQWHFGENNPLAGGKTYRKFSENVIKNYREVCRMHQSQSRDNEVTVLQGDAGDLEIANNSVEAIIIDPPYGDNVMYSELSDALYVWLRKYLGPIFPEKFDSLETNKSEEAVENPAIATEKGDESETEAARREYEEKMGKIFDECYRVLQPSGVITIYFTDKEVEAWDSLTMSIIDSGFTITSTHTVTSDNPERFTMQDRSSADTSLLLTCRKPAQQEDSGDRVPTLWSDIKSKTEDAAQKKAEELLNSNITLTKTNIIIGAFGPTLRVFTENYPVVDKYDERVRPKQALEVARNAVTEVLIEEELGDDLEGVDSLTKWYILSWVVYEREEIPYDEARQLGLGVGVRIDDVKTNTKIWSKSKSSLMLRGEDYRVQDYTELESGGKRRSRAYPIDPREDSFSYDIDAVHAALNVLNTKGGEFAWNWLSERNYQNNASFNLAVKSLLQVLPEGHPDYESLINLASGETGDLLNIEVKKQTQHEGSQSRTTLNDF
jgi:adenine-specific DNA methylase